MIFCFSAYWCSVTHLQILDASYPHSHKHGTILGIIWITRIFASRYYTNPKPPIKITHLIIADMDLYLICTAYILCISRLTIVSCIGGIVIISVISRYEDFGTWNWFSFCIQGGGVTISICTFIEIAIQICASALHIN